MISTEVIVLRFGGRRLPRALAALPCREADGMRAIDAAIRDVRRVVVAGSPTDLAAVLTRLMRTESLDVEVAHVDGRRGARRAVNGVARRVPLIRDETATVLVGAALWLPPEGCAVIRGETVVDDAVLFDGAVGAVRIEPTTALPGLRATVSAGRLRRRWLAGRAVQLGTTGARVVRDGVEGPREVKRSTFYRHTTGWLRVG
ncbi:MAG: peptidase M50 [Mycobacterium sp.]|nr:peptidase M50 [Mycobacterium sp.]